MLNQGNNMSYYGRSEYFRHLRIERLDGDVTPVFSDYLRTVRTLPFTVVTCQERLEGFPYHGSSCIFEDEGEIHAEGASCWVIPAGVRHRFLALDEGHLSIWGHFNFFLEPNWNILRFYRVPRLLEGEVRERICGLVRILAENRHETLSEVCRLKRAEFELLELILEQSEPRLGLQDFRTAYLDFLPLLEYIRAHLAESPGLDRLAREFGTSRSSLEKKFRKAFGVSIGKFLLNSRLAEAAKLLRDESVSCAEAADATGFANQFAFSKAFRKAFQLSPQEYRRNRVG